ncbi:hypothetical protein Pyn_16122 [Prunus yedoensis var. nudiflora]|uniref:Uncharacterized protein n=1 Tax=Prunus yedoensis var. nudiflora TaxID=2094558 RepID=A0A314V0I4_PRUYE|nr:hypothetical protein Pyn_16122 [Prunus yedoensis var. nudiflora]
MKGLQPRAALASVLPLDTELHHGNVGLRTVLHAGPKPQELAESIPQVLTRGVRHVSVGLG